MFKNNKITIKFSFFFFYTFLNKNVQFVKKQILDIVKEKRDAIIKLEEDR